MRVKHSNHAFLSHAQLKRLLLCAYENYENFKFFRIKIKCIHVPYHK